jgi:hypothetical protein
MAVQAGESGYGEVTVCGAAGSVARGVGGRERGSSSTDVGGVEAECEAESLDVELRRTSRGAERDDSSTDVGVEGDWDVELRRTSAGGGGGSR